MSDVTQILSRIHEGDSSAAEQLLPLVYDELRKLAAAKMAREKPGQTLQATALVHEAYIRLVDSKNAQQWNSRSHFFAAAAEAMRRILVEEARRKRRKKRGGALQRVELNPLQCSSLPPSGDLLDLNDALNELAVKDRQTAEFVKLHYFGGLSIADAAELVGLSRSAACEHWAFARAWMRRRMQATGERAAD
jgi:RNA polymerase sigma factor (TIGR02999 family)